MAKYLTLMILFLWFFTGCSTIQNHPIPPQQKVKEGQARIILFREKAFEGSLVRTPIKDGSIEIGDISNGGTLTWNRLAGKTCLTTTGPWNNYPHEICFDAAVGQEYKLTLHLVDGFFLTPPLIIAVDQGNTAIVEDLLKAGEDPDLSQNEGRRGITRTPLIIASQKGNYQIAELLLKNGANPNLPNKHGFTPLMSAYQKE